MSPNRILTIHDLYIIYLASKNVYIRADKKSLQACQTSDFDIYWKIRQSCVYQNNTLQHCGLSNLPTWSSVTIIAWSFHFIIQWLLSTRQHDGRNIQISYQHTKCIGCMSAPARASMQRQLKSNKLRHGQSAEVKIKHNQMNFADGATNRQLIRNIIKLPRPGRCHVPSITYNYYRFGYAKIYCEASESEPRITRGTAINNCRQLRWASGGAMSPANLVMMMCKLRPL